MPAYYFITGHSIWAIFKWNRSRTVSVCSVDRGYKSFMYPSCDICCPTLQGTQSILWTYILYVLKMDTGIRTHYDPDIQVTEIIMSVK